MSTQKTTNGKTVTRRQMSNTVLVDTEKLCAITKERGYSPTKVCNIVGITPSSYWTWRHNGGHANKDSVKRIAKLFGVGINELCLNSTAKTVSPTVNTVEVDTNKHTDDSVVQHNFKDIGETQNVHTLFNIVNTNVVTLSSVLTDYIDKKFDVMYKQLHADLVDLVSGYNRDSDNADVTIDDIEDKPKTTTKPRAFIVNKDEVNALLNGYADSDSYEDYRNKINRMIGIYSSYSRIPHKKILHDAYLEMTNVYGVVYKQLKKEYFEKYQHTDSGSSELIYENAIFRQIFYNMISDKLRTVVNV